MKRSSDSQADATKGGTGSSGSSSGATPTERPGLLTLPPELSLHAYLDGGGAGGTQDLYALSCTHRSLAHYAGLATRLDVRALVGRFDIDSIESIDGTVLSRASPE